MKKAVIGYVSLASVATLGAVAAPAQASSGTNFYFHGTARMTSFSTWNQCQGYADWSVRNVTAHGGRVIQGAGDNGSRTKCFPVANGRWTYLTGYQAAEPISAGDIDDVTAGNTFGDSVWAVHHEVTGPTRTFTAAKCAAANSSFRARVIAGTDVRLLPSQGCSVSAGTSELDVAYLARTKASAFSGDTASLWHSSELSEAWTLGYKTQAD